MSATPRPQIEMNTEQLQQFLRDYPDGVTAVFYEKQEFIEAWYRNAEFDEQIPEFIQADIMNLPTTFDYRYLLLHFTKTPLYINNEPLYLECYSDETIFLENDSNKNIQRVALTAWPERKILLGVGCQYNEEGYLQALKMLKNDKLIKEQQLKQREVRLTIGDQIFNLDIIRVATELRRKSQREIFFWFKDFKEGTELLPELYQIIKEYPQIYFTFSFSQETKAAIESNLPEYYYLNLINIAECINEDMINSLTLNTSENESKGFYFTIPAESDEDQDAQTQGSLFDKETGEKNLLELIEKLESLEEQTSFNKKETNQEYCLFNMEHSQLLGFHGKGLKYVEQVPETREAKYNSYCLFEVALEDEKSVEYVRSILVLQKKYSNTYFVVSLRNQFNINSEFLTTIEQKDRSFKELNLVEGFSHTLRAELGEDSERQAFVGYLYIDNQEQICNNEVYKEVDKFLAHYQQELDRLKDETPDMLEADYDCLVDEAAISDEGLMFRGYKFKPLSVIEPYAEGKDYAVCYLNRGAGFEKSCEIIYRLKEMLSSRCYFMVIVKGVDEKSQITELSKRAFYLERLNVYQYRHGFNKFMEACNKSEFNNEIVFYTADNQYLPVNIEDAANSINILNFAIQEGQQLQDLLKALFPEQQRQEEVLNKKPAQLLEINKPLHNEFVHSGVVFSGQLYTEYNKQKFVMFVFLNESMEEEYHEVQTKLLELHSNKVCNNLMYTLICGENVNQSNISSTMLEKDPNYRKLNYVYDYNNNCRINADIAMCQVWDVQNCTCHMFQSIDEVEKEYLEAAIQDARKNTNIYTEDEYIELQQVRYDYSIKSEARKQPTEECLFVYLGSYNNTLLLPELQFVNNLEKYYRDFYIVVGINFSGSEQVDELKQTYFYINDLNIVGCENEGFSQMYQFNFSDQNGLQQQIGQSKEELLSIIENKSKYKEYAEQKIVLANRSMSVIIDGVQMPYLNKFNNQMSNKIIIVKESASELLDEDVLLRLEEIESKNIYLLVAVRVEEFREINQLMLRNSQLCEYNIINDSSNFLQDCKQYIYISEANERSEFDDFEELSEKVLDKTGKCQVDENPCDTPTLEVTVAERRLELMFEHRFKQRCGHETVILTFYEDIERAGDMLYQQFEKQQTNSMNYYIAVFPTEKLLKEISKAEEFFAHKDLIRHYNQLNIATCDQMEMMDLVGHTYVNINHKYTRMELSEIDMHCMCEFSGFEDPIVASEECVKQLGINVQYIRKDEDFKPDCRDIVLYPLDNDGEKIDEFLAIEKQHPDVLFIAEVDEFIKGEQITQIERYRSDRFYRIFVNGRYSVEEGPTLNLQAAKERAYEPQRINKIFDYELSQNSRLDPDKDLFELQGYSFELLEKVQTYQEGEEIYYLNINNPNMEEIIRFAEETHSSSVFAFVTLKGVQCEQDVQEIEKQHPMLKTINIAKYADGMELIPPNVIYEFNENLQITRVHDVYTVEAFSPNPDIQKVTFDLKFGQRLPGHGEEGYNPANPTVLEDGTISFKCKGRRFRFHKSKYMGEQYILWVQDAKITYEELVKLDAYVERGVLVIGYLPQVPVFDDEVRFEEEQIEAEARKDMEDIPEEDKKLLEEEKKRQFNETRIRSNNIEIVDFECGPETEGYYFMDASAKGVAMKVSPEELEELLPAAAKEAEDDEEKVAEVAE